ncbi:hypothetical protein BU25DRAFT_420292 [Macroventuria anomochaeta]|uniref:Uncharacterized protein n=1 Tax=Macroventuria anomochaeta TaxID=301207 RepID=A0ACB6S8B2_9PLEO|nr:uncharacterized protein BU25DRAFT_420292 [Macroventuria anomochaeta]KAF2629454.1 hypothetical protein BU25DRAFT_420292 [Macroventuria anomochaeta]
MSDSPASPFTERMAKNADAYPLRPHPTIPPTTSPPICQDAPEHNESNTRCSKCRFLCSLHFFSALFYLVLLTLFIVVFCAKIFDPLSPDQLSPSKENDENGTDKLATLPPLTRRVNVLLKRWDAGQLDDHMMLYVLAGGFGFAFIGGVSMSWYLQRKQLGRQKRRYERVVIWRNGEAV